MSCPDCGDLALLTLTAAGRVMGISRWTVQKMIRAGELSCIARGRRGRRVPVWAIREWQRRAAVTGQKNLKSAVDRRRAPTGRVHVHA